MHCTILKGNMPDSAFPGFSCWYLDALEWYVTAFPHTCKACDTVTNCVQVSVSTQHACLARTVNMNSSSLAPSESDRLPSPHEGDYTNLCKACKWFILQSTTKGFFTTPRTRRGERERETLTPAVIPTFAATCILLCCATANRRGAIKHDGICAFFFDNKTKRLHSRHNSVISKEVHNALFSCTQSSYCG